jgi:hypothetical protein
MFRKIAKIAALLIAGPVLAFLVLLAGCGGSEPFFGTMCGHNILVSVVAFTLAAWFIFAMGNAVIRSLRNKE